MLPFRLFDDALPYSEFLKQYGTPADRERWDASRAAVTLTEEHLATLKPFTRAMKVLTLAGAWCGDCSKQCPIFERFAEAAPVIEVRYLDRDAYADAQKELQINGGNRVPVAVIFSEDGHEVLRYGERTLTAYRQMTRSLAGGAFGASGAGAAPPSPSEVAAGVAGDWLREFERAQIILRLSPRLRRLHGD